VRGKEGEGRSDKSQVTSEEEDPSPVPLPIGERKKERGNDQRSLSSPYFSPLTFYCSLLTFHWRRELNDRGREAWGLQKTS
jgi:hypothetical protein